VSDRYRTSVCGDVDTTRVDERVVLSGFVGRLRDHGGLVFIDLRDRSGVVQVVIDPEAVPHAHHIRVESVVRVDGTVVRRSPQTVNPKLATGEVEVTAASVEVVSAADPLPFQLDDEGVDETLRIRHRALDLRRDVMTRRIQTRVAVTRAMRHHLEDNGFWELETPILGKSTPEGARDFLVPARLAPGSFYALPQSPQLYKQLYMLAGYERYYQIARCFRDEAQRADRQLEFTQLDIEMAYVTEQDVLGLVESLYAQIWREVADVTIPLPIPRIAYADAVARYGSDRPDLRYGMEIADVTALVTDCAFVVFRNAAQSGGVVRGLACPGAADLSRRELDELAGFAREWGGQGLAYLLVGEGREVRSPIAKFLTADQLAGILDAVGAGPGHAVFLAADTTPIVCRVLGALRPHLAARRGLIAPDAWAFALIVDFPAFQWDADEQRFVAEHHMFTAPKPEHVELLESDPAAVLSQAYDLVINGHEAGGGSIRIHRADVQQRVFNVVGLDADDADERFGFLLRALRLGAPPHGGVAFGLDRTVMLLSGADSIRDVIAFPKIAGGVDPLTDAPTPVDQAQLDDIGLAVAPPPKR
jgi:aspartyl-tRNA synthetase